MAKTRKNQRKVQKVAPQPDSGGTKPSSYAMRQPMVNRAITGGRQLATGRKPYNTVQGAQGVAQVKNPPSRTEPAPWASAWPQPQPQQPSVPQSPQPVQPAPMPQQPTGQHLAGGPATTGLSPEQIAQAQALGLTHEPPPGASFNPDGSINLPMGWVQVGGENGVPAFYTNQWNGTDYNHKRAITQFTNPYLNTSPFYGTGPAFQNLETGQHVWQDPGFVPTDPRQIAGLQNIAGAGGPQAAAAQVAMGNALPQNAQPMPMPNPQQQPQPQPAPQPNSPFPNQEAAGYAAQNVGNNYATLEREYENRLAQGYTGDKFLEQHPKFAANLQGQGQDRPPMQPGFPPGVDPGGRGGFQNQQGQQGGGYDPNEIAASQGTRGENVGQPMFRQGLDQTGRQDVGTAAGVRQGVIDNPQISAQKIESRANAITALPAAGVSPTPGDNAGEPSTELGLPLSPEFEAGRRALDDALSAQLAEIGMAREEIAATKKLIEARLATDLQEDLRQVDEGANARGIYNSSIRGDNRGRAEFQTGRRLQDVTLDAARQFREMAAAESGARSSYLKGIAELLAQAARTAANDENADAGGGSDEGGGGSQGGTPSIKPPSKPPSVKLKKSGNTFADLNAVYKTLKPAAKKKFLKDHPKFAKNKKGK